MKGFCVIGLGNFGINLALDLAKNGHQVLAIDATQEKIDAISPYVTDALCGDATNEAVLRTAGIDGCDCAIICMENNLQDAILISLILKEMGMPKIVVRASGEREKQVLLKVGADMVVLPEKESGTKLAFTLSKRDVLDYFALSEDFSVAEIAVPKSWIGRSLIEVDVRKKYALNVIACRNTNSAEFGLINDPNAKFSEGDTLVIAGTNSSIRTLMDN